MSARSMERDRPWPAGATFLDADPSDGAGAAAAFVAYAGSYECTADEVVHHVALSLYPEMTGTDLVRRISWDGDELVLTTNPITTGSGKLLDDQLRWRPLG